MARMVEEEQKEKRKERVPLGGGRQRLAAPEPRPGYVQRWINDSPGRIDQALAGGYSFVGDPSAPKSGDPIQNENETTDPGSRMSRVVGAAPGGTGMRSYLMEIPEEFYNEDQAAKHRRLDEIDAQIDAGRLENKIAPHLTENKIKIDRPNKEPT